MELGLHDTVLHLVVIAARWYTGYLVVSSGVFLHLELHVVLHIMLAKHRVATSSRGDLLHPVLLLTLHVSVIVDLPIGWQYRQLGSVYDLSHARLSIL